MNKMKFSCQFLAVLSVAILLLCASCSSEKSSNPVGSDMSYQAAAKVNGQVLSSCPGSVNGINVSIVGTDLTAVTDAQGLFALQGAPLGDQQLAFAQGDYQGSMVINDIKARERITVQVHFESAAVTVESMGREASFEGQITVIDPGTSSITVEGTVEPIVIESTTEFEGDIQVFEDLFVGLMVEGEAIKAADMGWVATKIEAEYQEAEFKGAILTIDELNLSFFTVAGFLDPIYVDEYTVYEGELTGFADLRVGQLVKGEGVYKGFEYEQRFYATKVELETDDEEEVELGEFRAVIKPNSWNLNWQGSSGHFSVEIRGEGYADVDTTSPIILEGDSGATLESLSAKRSGHHVRAFFAKMDAFTLLEEAVPGNSYEITITGTLLDGTTFVLTDTIYVLGPTAE
ncbi:hypothetical protein CEE39_09940 [bacterium (candidate division B38) B3_B38]|nr:MAG: hypothetical protein CEE39_09940 [bacterium (candidate division B38) B3_B38]